MYPSSEKFSQILYLLLEQNKWVLLVQLAEKWSAVQPLPAKGALYEGQALLSLCAMDRAWARAREVLEKEPQNTAALLLIIEIYLRRGWPGKARKMLALLQNLEKNHPRLAELESRAFAPKIGMPKNFELIANKGTVSQLIKLAERMLGLGKIVLGKQLLLRALRGAPNDLRIKSLLWVLRGELLVKADFSFLWNRAVNVVAEEDMVEPTVAVPKPEEQNNASAFPELFHDELTAALTAEITSENTEAMSFSENEITVHMEEESLFKDTQMLDFVGDDGLETEEKSEISIIGKEVDEDVVVFTQLEESQSESPAKIALQKPQPRPIVKESPRKPEQDKPSIPPPKRKESRISIWVLLSLVGSALVFFVIFLLVIMGLWQENKDTVAQDTMTSILQLDHKELVKQRIYLQKKLAENEEAKEDWQEYLALNCAFLWKDYTFDPKDLQCAEDKLLTTTGWPSKVVQTILLMGEGDYEQAGELLGSIVQPNELVWILQNEIEMSMGKKVAWKHISPSPRKTIAMLKTGATIKVSNKMQENTWIQLQLLENKWSSMSESKRVKKVAHLWKERVELPQRQLAQLELLKSYILPDEQAQKMRKDAHQKDPSQPSILYWIGWDIYKKGDFAKAERKWAECQIDKIDCGLSRLMVLIDMDRLQSAAEHAETLQHRHPWGKNLLRWVKWAEGKPVAASITGTLGAYLSGKSISSPQKEVERLFQQRILSLHALQKGEIKKGIDPIVDLRFALWLAKKKKGRRAGAVAHRAVSRNMNYVRGWRLLGELLFQRSGLQEARSAWKTYLASKPKPNGPQVQKISLKLR